MLHDVFFKLGMAGLLSSVLSFGVLVRAVVAADGAADREEKTQTGATAAEPRCERKVKVASICRVKGEGRNIFTKDGKLTLVLNAEHANYLAAQVIAEVFNGPQIRYQNGNKYVATALDQATIEVALPPQYQADPVLFICQLLSLTVTESSLGEPPPGFDGLAQKAKRERPCESGFHPDEGPAVADVCWVQGEGENIFTQDGTLTLAVHEFSAGYCMVQGVVDAINGPQFTSQNDGKPLARALDRAHIELAVPSSYDDDPVAFISQVLDIPLAKLERETARENASVAPSSYVPCETPAASFPYGPGGLYDVATEPPSQQDASDTVSFVTRLADNPSILFGGSPDSALSAISASFRETWRRFLAGAERD